MNFFEKWKDEFWSFATRITFGTRRIWTNCSSCRPNHAGLDPECGRPGSLATGLYPAGAPPFSSIFLQPQILDNLVISPLCVRLSLFLVPRCRYLSWNGSWSRVCQNEVPVFNLGNLSLAQTALHARCLCCAVTQTGHASTGDTKFSTELFFSPGSTQNTEKWHDPSQPHGQHEKGVESPCFFLGYGFDL